MSYEHEGVCNEEECAKTEQLFECASEETKAVLNGDTFGDTAMTTTTSTKVDLVGEREMGKEEEGGGGNGMKECVEGNLRESLMSSWDDEEWPCLDYWSLSWGGDVVNGGKENDFEEEVLWEDDVWHLKDIKEIPHS